MASRSIEIKSAKTKTDHIGFAIERIHLGKNEYCSIREFRHVIHYRNCCSCKARVTANEDGATVKIFDLDHNHGKPQNVLQYGSKEKQSKKMKIKIKSKAIAKKKRTKWAELQNDCVNQWIEKNLFTTTDWTEIEIGRSEFQADDELWFEQMNYNAYDQTKFCNVWPRSRCEEMN